MGLPIGINQLLNGKVVEWERIDFKKGWNPEDVVHSICAFANDMHNWGGGYIVIGVEEDKGTPMLPPIGIDIKDLDDIQKEVLNLMHKIEPLPIVIPEPVEYMGKNILILWIPGGEARPYKAPIHLGTKEMQKAYFIRQGSVTKKATLQEEQVLLSLAAKIPFDDRICHSASLDDLSLLYIRDFLRKVDSDITEKDIQSMPFEQLCWQMQIIGGTPEFIRPKNVGLLFFSENPEKYIPYARIELVRFYDDVGDHFDEKILHGPIHLQLQEALDYIRSQVIVEKVVKVDDKAEANRAYNYPYTAIEEVLSNAVYHKDYAVNEPVTVTIRPDRITVLSIPGPDRSISDDDLRSFNLSSPRYRNARIGDLLKHRGLAEKRGTGIPTILKSLKENGSQPPILETDSERSFFRVTMMINESFLNQGHEAASTVTDSRRTNDELKTEIKKLLRDHGAMSMRELTGALGYSRNAQNVYGAIRDLVEKGVVEYTLPDKMSSRNQRIRLRI